jgi:hypothetical protein
MTIVADNDTHVFRDLDNWGRHMIGTNTLENPEKFLFVNQSHSSQIESPEFAVFKCQRVKVSVSFNLINYYLPS